LHPPFAAELTSDPKWTSEIPDRDWLVILGRRPSKDLTESAVQLFIAECSRLAKQGVHVIICAPSPEMLEWVDSRRRDVDPTEQALDESDDRESPLGIVRPAFHDVLKARALNLAVPLQMVRGETYGLAAVQKSGGRRLSFAKTLGGHFKTGHQR